MLASTTSSSSAARKERNAIAYLKRKLVKKVQEARFLTTVLMWCQSLTQYKQRFVLLLYVFSNYSEETVFAYVLRQRELAGPEMPSLPIVSLIVREELEQTLYADVLRRVHGHDGPLSEMERRVKLFWLEARLQAKTKTMNDTLGVTLQVQDVRDLMIPMLGPAADVLSPVSRRTPISLHSHFFRGWVYRWRLRFKGQRGVIRTSEDEAVEQQRYKAYAIEINRF